MSSRPNLRSAARSERNAAPLVAALLVTSLTFAMSGQAVAAAAAAGGGDACDGDPATSYTLTAAGNVASGTVTFTAAGAPPVAADYRLTTTGLVGHRTVDISIQDRNRFGRGIEYIPQERASLGADTYWTSPFGDAVTATFDVEVDADAEDSAARVRLMQVLGNRGGNSEASTYTVSWVGTGVAVVSDPVQVNTVYRFGAPGDATDDAFARANGEIEGRKTGDTLESGDSFVVFATKNSLSEWSIEFPAGARDIRVEKVALFGATHAKGVLAPADRDDEKQGRDVQLPRYGVFLGSPGGVSDGAPGQTYNEFLAFQVLFVAADCIAPAVVAVPEDDDDVKVVDDKVDDVQDKTVDDAATTTSDLLLACTPDPVVERGLVPCEVSGGDPDIDILWAAMIDGVAFDGRGVTLASDGTGRFTFRAPVGSIGSTIDVELVEWNVADTVSVGGPVPTLVPAGEGSGAILGSSVLGPLSLIALAAILLPAAARRRPTRWS